MSATSIQTRRTLIAALAVLVTAAAALVATDRAEAAKTKCPGTFQVLHNDHIGKLSLPAGPYVIRVIDVDKLSCKRASKLFARFLQDFDGKLGNGWKVKAKKSGFKKRPRIGFFVKRKGGGGGRHPGKGKARCPGTFQVEHNDHIGKLQLPKGPYKITLIKKNKISCQKASNLFAQFLDHPDGKLPNRWRVKPRNGSFVKQTNGKGFQVKPAR